MAVSSKKTTNQMKVGELAKNLGIKPKEITELLGIDSKQTQSIVEAAAFDKVLNTLTLQNQVTSIEKYLNGEIIIKGKEEKAPANKEAEKPTSQTPSNNKEEKTEQKTENKQDTPAVQVNAPVANKENKQETKNEAKPSANEKAPVSAPKQPPVPDNKRVSNKPYSGNPFHPGESAPIRQGTPTNRPQTQNSVRPQNGQNMQNRPQNNSSARPMQNGNFNRNPQGNPYNNQNRPYNQNQGQNGFKKPLNGNGTRPAQTPFNNKPQTPVSSVQAENARLLAEMGLGGNKKEAPRKKPNNHNQKPTNGYFDRDKDEKTISGPKETFKAQPIVRGASTNVNPDGTVKGPRYVDTHTSDVDLSKYDEKLDQFTSDKDDIHTGTQKLKKTNSDSQQKIGQTYVNPKFQKGGKGKGQKSNVVNTVKPTSIEIPDEIVVGQLASKLMVTAGEVVKKLIGMGMMATINQVIDFDTAALVADEFGVSATQEKVVTIEEKLFDDETDSDEELITRAPVICVMGHVDHGKTSILDAIRKTHVTAGEAGGITQHIGAYRVSVKGREITFLDTPGHAAFTAMRARGAMATDIAILVVAADDGIMPQTVEAINHAKAAGIDIIVAINKMDKPSANPDQVKQELTKYDLVPEEWGGDVICVPVSALTGQGIDDLLESVLLVADVKELKANPNRRAKGLVIEAKLDKGRGPVATLLVQNGTLHSGDIIIAGTSVGRVRNMNDHNGKSMKTAGPSVPVEITGLAEVPSAGDEFQAVEDEKMARELADKRRNQAKEDAFKAHQRANLNDLFNQISEGVKEINVIVKADVDGSVEAVSQALTKLSNDEVKVRVIHAAAGGITEGDVTFAAASNAIIVGFNVRPDKTALDSAERQEVDIRTYRVIYECLDEMKAAMKGMLAPKFKENLLGHAEVRQTIHVPSVGTIAGCYIQDGKITRQSQIRIVRDGVVIFEDKISSLKRFKDDAKEVAAGYECGVGLDKFNDIKIGDILEAFIMEQVEAELSDNGTQI